MKSFCTFSLACCFATLLLACTQQPVTIVKTVPSLRPSSIYKPDSVVRYRELHLNFHEEMADYYLAKARETEANNIKKAIFYTKRAITVNPQREHYVYLLRLLRKADVQEELSRVYRLLAFKQYNSKTNTYVYLFEPPSDDLLYDYLVFELANRNYRLAGEVIDAARELNYSLPAYKKKLLTDEKLTLQPTSETYKNLMLLFMTEAEIKDYQNSPENFRNFLASITETSHVFEIDEKEAQTFQYDNEEDWEAEETIDFTYLFKAFLPETRQNPNHWTDYQAKHRVHLNDSIIAVVYAVDTSAIACPVDMRHIYHRLVTFGKKGNMIATQIVAVQAAEKLATVSFVGNTFTVTDFSRTWKNPYHKENFDNYLTAKERLGEQTFEIRGDGKIYPLAPLAAEAE